MLNARTLIAMYRLGNKILNIYGLPGGGKTRTVVYSMILLARALGTRLIVSVPLRSLRNWLVERYIPSLGYSAEMIRSKEETCPHVRDSIHDCSNILEYLYNLVRTCGECGESYCEFRSQIREFFQGSGHIWVMTHNLLYVLYLMNSRVFNRTILVIDEADSLADLYRLAFTRRELEHAVRNMRRDRYWREVVRRVLRSVIQFGNLYFYRPELPLGRLTVLISATLHPRVISCFNIPQTYTIYYAGIRAQVLDRYALYPQYLSSIEGIEQRAGKYLSPSRWVPELAETVIDLVDRGKSIGIASKNYQITLRLEEMLRERGIDVRSDVSCREPPHYGENIQVIIWTTRGRWFRGVSLPDTDIIFCLYQTPTGADPTYMTHGYCDDDLDLAYDMVRIMNNAVNVQSYYRSNRRRDMEHTVVLLDVRSWEAMIETLRHYANVVRGDWYQRLSRPVKIRTVKELVEE
ncbi:MAG: hypothetical protein GXO26_08080 [Crenarchaeota archaeon]|nr:hypothetical protein [Thermoproteota archaeon]